MKKIFLTVLVASSMFVTQSALAVNPLGDAKTKLDSALGSTGLESKLEVSIGTVVKGMLSIVGTVFLLLTVYAGILWMTAQGNEEKVTKAKDTIQAAVIGLFIVMAAYAITTFVTSKVGGSSSGGSGLISCTGSSGQCLTACNPALWTEVNGTDCTGSLGHCCK